MILFCANRQTGQTSHNFVCRWGKHLIWAADKRKALSIMYMCVLVHIHVVTSQVGMLPLPRPPPPPQMKPCVHVVHVYAAIMQTLYIAIISVPHWDVALSSF